MKTGLHVFLIATAASNHLGVGALVHVIGKVHRSVYMELGAELPMLTRLVVNGAESGAMIMIAAACAVLTAVGLPLSKRVRVFDAFSVGLSISYLLALAHLGIAALAFTIPLLRMTNEMGN